MKAYLLNYLLCYAECFLCAAAIIALHLYRQLNRYFYFACFLAVRFSADIGMAAILIRRRTVGHDPTLFLYHTYVLVYWVSYAMEAALLLLTIFEIYSLAMAPLEGLQRLGTIVFRWIGAISVAISVGLAIGPHLTSRDFLARAVTQLQQTSSILTLCLLLFVCFAIRPMGLSYRSRIFGVSLGLGLLATANLLASAWFITNKNMYSPLSLIESLAVCASFVIWTIYLIVPEPKRRMIVLPTTSPFLRWNQISLALGDNPGYVAVAGVPPEMFADAEIEVMTRASRKMTDAVRSFDLGAQPTPTHLASLSIMGTEVRAARSRQAGYTVV